MKLNHPTKKKINALNNEFKELNYEFTIYQKEIEPFYKGIIDTLNNDLNRYNKYAKDKITRLKSVIHKITLYNKYLEESNKELEILNNKLRQETSTYQTALDDALNCHLKDDDMNNSVQFSTNVCSLQDRL